MIIPQIQPRSITNQSILQKTANKVGVIIPNAISKQFEMTKMGSLGRASLLILGLVFVLGVRWYKSRDAHERREVLTRDGVTVASAMVAVPIVKNWMQRGIDSFSKIPTATERNKLFSTNDFGFDNIGCWYSKANLMPEKVLTMAKNITERKGDLKKAFGTLGEEGMKHIRTMLNGNEATSENILNALKSAYTSTDANIKNAFENLTQILSNPKNNLVKAAQRLKAIPNLASLVFVISLLGYGIPALNIHITRKKLKHNNEKHVENQQKKRELPKSKFNNPSKNILEPEFNVAQQDIVNLFLLKNQQKK